MTGRPTHSSLSSEASSSVPRARAYQRSPSGSSRRRGPGPALRDRGRRCTRPPSRARAPDSESPEPVPPKRAAGLASALQRSETALFTGGPTAGGVCGADPGPGAGSVFTRLRRSAPGWTNQGAGSNLPDPNQLAGPIRGGQVKPVTVFFAGVKGSASEPALFLKRHP